MFDLNYRKIEIAKFGEFYRTRDNSRHDTENGINFWRMARI